MAEKKLCIKCFGMKVVRCGLSKSYYQLYECCYCGHRFSDTGLKIGRPKTYSKCILCGVDATTKELCDKCYAKEYKKRYKLK